MPIIVTNGNLVYGSVIFEEVGTDDMILEFYSAQFDPSGKKKFEPEYP